MVDDAAETETPTLAVFGDFACPFCWLAQPEIERACAELGIGARHHAFELRPLPAPYPDERYMRRLWEQGVLPIARTRDLEPSFPTVRTRTRKAHEAVAFAQERALGPALRAALFDAYFRDGRDIGRIDVLAELAAAVGLDGHELRLALDADRYADAVAADREAARVLGLPAVPAFVLRSGGVTVTRTGWCDGSDLRRWIEDNLKMVHA